MTHTEWLDRTLFPYEQQRLELDGHEVAYVDEGEGPPLLMLHGNPTWSFVYRDVIAGLRDRFRCVAPDLPGFGFSTAAAGFGFRPVEHARVIERFVEALGLRDATLVAQDWGGPIGLWVAARQPERLWGDRDVAFRDVERRLVRELVPRPPHGRP